MYCALLPRHTFCSIDFHMNYCAVDTWDLFAMCNTKVTGETSLCINMNLEIGPLAHLKASASWLVERQGFLTVQDVSNF